ncbi:hypothetical protein MKX01_016372 [Papaver californicum]|nr:hypothetical protein MKX01_016372 [Papaver californicum]
MLKILKWFISIFPSPLASKCNKFKHWGAYGWMSIIITWRGYSEEETANKNGLTDAKFGGFHGGYPGNGEYPGGGGYPGNGEYQGGGKDPGDGGGYQGGGGRDGGGYHNGGGCGGGGGYRCRHGSCDRGGYYRGDFYNCCYSTAQAKAFCHKGAPNGSTHG